MARRVSIIAWAGIFFELDAAGDGVDVEDVDVVEDVVESEEFELEVSLFVLEEVEFVVD